MNDARSCCATRATSCSTKSASRASSGCCAAHALVIGAGGLGSPAALYLASAGVGRITLVDDDEVDLTNLQRQIAHTTARVGQPRSSPARAAMRAHQPRRRDRAPSRSAPTRRCSTSWSRRPTWCSTAATTSPPATRSTAPASRTRSRWCRARRSASTASSACSTRATPHSPCYACLFPRRCRVRGARCATHGRVRAAGRHRSARMQAAEALKLLTGIGASLAGSLLMLDGRAPRSTRCGWRAIRSAPSAAAAHRRPAEATRLLLLRLFGARARGARTGLFGLGQYLLAIRVLARPGFHGGGERQQRVDGTERQRHVAARRQRPGLRRRPWAPRRCRLSRAGCATKRMLASLGRCRTTRSRDSLPRSMSPVAWNTVSEVSNTRLRPCITPRSTSKASAPQRSMTLRSPRSTNLMISPPSRPMNSSSRLLNSPRPVRAATSPEALPSQAATELPRPERLMRPIELAETGLQGLDLGDQPVDLHRTHLEPGADVGRILRAVDADRAEQPPAGDAQVERIEREDAVLELDLHAALVERQFAHVADALGRVADLGVHRPQPFEVQGRGRQHLEPAVGPGAPCLLQCGRRRHACHRLGGARGRRAGRSAGPGRPCPSPANAACPRGRAPRAPGRIAFRHRCRTAPAGPSCPSRPRRGRACAARRRAHRARSVGARCRAGHRDRPGCAP